jgi:hypothetical protein
MDTNESLNTGYDEADGLDTNTEAVTEWLQSIDARLKSINRGVNWITLVVVIAAIIAVIQWLF